MKIIYALCAIAFSIGLEILASSAFAGGLSLLGVSSRANTLQAFTGVADDPSALYYNPAGITQIKGTAIEGDLYYVNTPAHYFSILSGVGTSSNKKIEVPDVFVTHDAGQGV